MPGTITWLEMMDSRRLRQVRAYLRSDDVRASVQTLVCAPRNVDATHSTTAAARNIVARTAPNYARGLVVLVYSRQQAGDKEGGFIGWIPHIIIATSNTKLLAVSLDTKDGRWNGRARWFLIHKNVRSYDVAMAFHTYDDTYEREARDVLRALAQTLFIQDMHAGSQWRIAPPLQYILENPQDQSDDSDSDYQDEDDQDEDDQDEDDHDGDDEDDSDSDAPRASPAELVRGNTIVYSSGSDSDSSDSSEAPPEDDEDAPRASPAELVRGNTILYSSGSDSDSSDSDSDLPNFSFDSLTTEPRSDSDSDPTRAKALCRLGDLARWPTLCYYSDAQSDTEFESRRHRNRNEKIVLSHSNSAPAIVQSHMAIGMPVLPVDENQDDAATNAEVQMGVFVHDLLEKGGRGNPIDLR